MPDVRTDWPDSRITALEDQVRRMADTVSKVGVIEATLKAVAEDASECRQSIAGLRDGIDDAAKTQVTERKSDRRWLIGTCLTTAALIISAAAVLLGNLGG